MKVVTVLTIPGMEETAQKNGQETDEAEGKGAGGGDVYEIWPTSFSAEMAVFGLP